MPFPATPSNSEHEELFLIQDPFGLGRVVLPLWDLRNSGETLIGLGSAFRIDNQGAMLTAYHVLEDSLAFDTRGSERPSPVPGANPLVLEIGGMALGRAPITDRNWIPIRSFDARIRARRDQFTEARPRNLTEWIAILAPSKIFGPADLQFAPCSNRRAEVRERLLAVGYANMSIGTETDKEEFGMISSYLYGSIRRIVEVIPGDETSTRPWPRYVVDGDWPAGMSGGPVFDESGVVVGFVSSGSPLGGYATARAFWGDSDETQMPFYELPSNG